MANHIKVTLKNLVQTETNKIEVDVYLKNDGTSNLKINAVQFGINFLESILNGGYPTLEYKDGTDLTNGKPFSYPMSASPKNHLRAVEAITTIGNSTTVNAGSEIKVGRFTITNSVDFKAGSTFAPSLQAVAKGGYTTTGAIAYVGAATTTTGFQQSANNLSVESTESIVLNQIS